MSAKLSKLLKPGRNPKAVIDTNIFISGLLNAVGTPAEVINAFDAGEFDLLISDEILKEYTSVVNRFSKISTETRANLLALIKRAKFPLA